MARSTEFTYGGHEHLTTAALATLTRNVKGGMQEAIDAQVADPSFASSHMGGDHKAMAGGINFAIKHSLLQGLEHEITRRGMDPKHPTFGPDMTGMVNDALKD